MSSSQVFKNKILPEKLFILLEEICSKEENVYIFNKTAFKKGVYEESIPKFLKECVPYYHASKQKYAERKMTYNNFTTVLRQICKSNAIPFTTEMKYDKSEYEIVYLVPFNFLN